MALAATTVWEVQTGGDDTNFGGAFDPGQTAGMFTDGVATVANTSAPIFSSVSYNFVAADVGAWIYLASGSTGATITPGWYKILNANDGTSGANKALIDATIGHAVIKGPPVVPSTVVGCANGASPTVITWTIDYSQQTTAARTYADLASAGTGLTCSSTAFPFGKQMVGNSLCIDTGGNFNAGRYVIASVAAVTFVATVVGPTNITTGAGSNGVGRLGGAVKSVGLVGGVIVGSNFLWIKSGTYTIASASTNIATGCWAPTVASVRTEGYQTVRGDGAARPLLQASSITTFSIWAPGSNLDHLTINIAVDGASSTASKGFAGGRGTLIRCKALNCKAGGFITAGGLFVLCEATGCDTVSAFTDSAGRMICYGCEAYGNTITGFTFANSAGACAINCISSGNTGATSDGFSLTASEECLTNCVAYGNGRHGVRISGAAGVLTNCLAESNAVTAAGSGFDNSAATTNFSLVNCGNFGGTATSGSFAMNVGFVTGASSFFTNAAAGDFSLNDTALAGAAARAAGLPGLFGRGLTTGYPDLGAAQHPNPNRVGLQHIEQGIAA